MPKRSVLSVVMVFGAGPELVRRILVERLIGLGKTENLLGFAAVKNVGA
jgi:hypothetical protein